MTEYGESDIEPSASASGPAPDPADDAPDGPVTFDRASVDLPDLETLRQMLPANGDDFRKTQMIRARVREVAKVHGAEVTADLGPERPPHLRQRREMSMTQAVRFRASQHRSAAKPQSESPKRPPKRRIGQLAAQDAAFLFAMTMLFTAQAAFRYGDSLAAGWIVALLMGPPILVASIGVGFSFWLDGMAKEDRHRYEAESMKHARALSKLRGLGQRLRRTDEVPR